ncbi:MAG: aminotransferase class I/II-fold pyridoxal phosphate-dependent enzyme [Pyrinomonadaceae bacterium]
MKTEINDLAIFGGTPAFAEKLHVGRPNFGDRQHLLERIDEIIDGRWFTNAGPFVKELEQKLAQFLGVKHCIAMCNATIALEIAIKALGLKGEVIVPSFTFIATAHALQWQEITPVFCDVDPETHNLDPRRVEELITPHTSGIIGVHLWGRPCDVAGLAEVAHRHRLALLFDAAHAFACSYAGRMIGSFGDAEVFSFHATKFFNTFEGGAVTTNDDELAARMRLMKNFGFAGYDNVIYIGTNGKMSEVCAAMGLTSLESLSEFIAVNQRNYNLYRQELKDTRGVKVIDYDPAEQNNYQYIVLEIDEAATGVGRDDLLNILWAENVIARRYFYPGCHRAEPYRTLYPDAGANLRVTEELGTRVLLLPNGNAVGEAEIRGICNVLRLAIGSAPEVKAALGGGSHIAAEASV